MRPGRIGALEVSFVLLTPPGGGNSVDTRSLWLSPAEISALPSSGTAFDRLETAALSDWGSPDLSSNDETHDTLTLSGAIYAAKTGDGAMLTKTRNALDAARSSGLNTVLELARGLQAYVIAADLIGYRESAFTAQVATWIDQTLNGHSTANSLRETAQRSANNWGNHSRASLAAAGLYLNNQSMIDDAVQGHQEFIGTYSGGSAEMIFTDTDWHFDDGDKAGVNRANAGIFSGTTPEDWRRDLTFDPTTASVLSDLNGVVATYLWEAIQGFITCTVLLQRAGSVSYSDGDSALQRSLDVLVNTAHPAEGDDRWIIPLANNVLGTSYSVTGIQDGKGMGWTDYTHG